MTLSDKVDKILEEVQELKIDLKTHLAVEETVWEQVKQNENEIRGLVKSNGQLRAKMAILIAAVSGAGASLPTILKSLL